MKRTKRTKSGHKQGQAMRETLGERIEKNIRYNEKIDTYYVVFNFAEVRSLKCFPTLEDARAYRDAVNAEKLRIKTEETLNKLRSNDLEDIAKSKDVYPYNAFAGVGIDAYRINPDIIDNFDKYLVDTCTEREVICVKDFYENKKTLRQIAEEHDVTRERIRQIIAKGLRKMTFFLYRYESMKKKEERNRQLEIIQFDLDKRRQELIQAFRETGKITDDMTVYFGEPTLDLDYSFETDTERLIRTGTIDDLDLSVRSYNCLKRAGLYKLSNLVQLTAEQVSHIRNLGRKSFKEVREKLSLCGIALEGEELYEPKI